MIEMYAAVIKEIVSATAGLECPGHGIARHVGNHIEERDQPFGVLEHTAPTIDFVLAASSHLEASIKRLAVALCIGPFKFVSRSESALLSAKLAYKDLATFLENQIIVFQFFALEVFDESAPTPLEVSGQRDRIVGPWSPQSENVLLPETKTVLLSPLAKAVLPPASIIDARALALSTLALRQDIP